MIIIFQHIAKTGGTSLGDSLGEFFPIDQQLSVHHGQDVSVLGTWSNEDARVAWEALSPERRDRIRFVGGHLRFGVHRVFDRPAKYVTLLRDPVERILSGFYYSIGRHFDLTGESVSLADYVFRKRHYDLGLNNYQTRILSGLPDLDPCGDFNTGNTRPVTRDDLDLAISNLREHYVLMGTIDNMAGFLLRFAELMGGTTPTMWKKNITASRPAASDVPHSILNEIRNHNRYDILLYEHVRDMERAR